MSVGRTFVPPQRNFANCILCQMNPSSGARAYPRTAAPLFFCTCLHVFRRPATRLLATALLFCWATTKRTLALSPALSTGGRFSIKSRKSMTSSRFLKYAQNRSTGFKSGDLGGICHKCTDVFVYSLWLARPFKKLSLSARMCHGPCATKVLNHVHA